jgi:hypothetical protein
MLLKYVGSCTRPVRPGVVIAMAYGPNPNEVSPVFWAGSSWSAIWKSWVRKMAATHLGRALHHHILSNPPFR